MALSAQEVKTCSKCKQEKSVIGFSKDSTKIDGLYSSCKECSLEKNRIYRQSHKVEISQWHEKYRLENPEKYKARATKSRLKNKEARNARIKAKYHANPEKSKQIYEAEYQMNKTKKSYQLRMRNSTLKRLYGITIEDFDAMYIEQGGCCAICGTHQSEMDRRLSIDHNHKTKQVRGLLCRKCNAGIGHFDDNLEILKNTIKYLEMEA